MKRLGILLTSLAILGLFFAPPLSAQWEPDVRLTYNGEPSYTPNNNAWCIATNHDTLYVVWTNNYSGYVLFFMRSTDGGNTWSSPTQLRSYGLKNDCAIAVSGPLVHIAFSDTETNPWSIAYIHSTDGGTTWGQKAFSTRGISPSIASRDTNIHLVWQDSREGSCEIYYKQSLDGGVTWSPDVRLTPYDSLCSHAPSVAAWRSSVHVTWYDSRDRNWEIYYRRSTDEGRTWEPDARLTHHPDTSVNPSIAVSDSNVHVIWRDTRDGNPELYYTHSTDGGTTWDHETRLTYDNAWSASPSIATAGSNVHLVWYDSRDTNLEIYYKKSTNGGVTWEADTRLTYDRAYSLNPSLVVADQKIHVVWSDERDGNYEIYYKRNATGNSGVETAEVRGQKLEVRITAKPNPFTSFARAPGYEKETFELYDIAGRKVGMYRGDRIGWDTGPGVYFLKYQEMLKQPMNQVQGMVQHDEIVRIVKLR